MRRGVWLPVAIGLVLLAVVGVLVFLRKQAPPEPARLLPEADAILYANLKPARVAYLGKHPVTPSPDYAEFEAQTGIQVERDLDEMAFAVHALENPIGSQGPFGFSEVFTGRFDGKRLAAYLASQSGSTEEYGGKTIYTIPHEGRTVRAAVLSYNMVAASNMPTTEQIHHIVDAWRTSALPFAGPSLLRDNYSDVPLLSFAWGIGRISAPFTNHGKFEVFSVPLPIPANATFIASARVLTAIHLRVEEIAPNEAAATVSASTMRALLALVKGEQRVANTVTGTTDPELASLLSSIAIEQNKQRAVITASVPFGLARRLVEPKQ